MQNLFKEVNLEVINWAAENKRIPVNFLTQIQPPPKTITRESLRDLYSELPDTLKIIVNRYKEYVLKTGKKSVIITGHDSYNKDLIAVIILLFYLNKGLKVQYYSHPNYKSFDSAPVTAIMRLPICDKFNIPNLRSTLTEMIASDRLFIVSCMDEDELESMVSTNGKDQSLRSLLHSRSVELRVPYIESDGVIIT